MVKSFEMAHYDGGLIQRGHDLDKDGGPASTLFSLLREHPARSIVVLVDIKHVEAICDSKWGCTFQFSISHKQRENCHTLIIASAKEPNYVVLLPTFYLPPAKSDITFVDAISSAPFSRGVHAVYLTNHPARESFGRYDGIYRGELSTMVGILENARKYYYRVLTSLSPGRMNIPELSSRPNRLPSCICRQHCCRSRVDIIKL